mmetsp:Transcript_58982/g.132007  ORF Transcript_58982/g.132007 Transcript_58982/m.132007 type:complete len:229 (+) Transcript_58982:1069-1755(+)
MSLPLRFHALRFPAVALWHLAMVRRTPGAFCNTRLRSTVDGIEVGKIRSPSMNMKPWCFQRVSISLLSVTTSGLFENTATSIPWAARTRASSSITATRWQPNGTHCTLDGSIPVRSPDCQQCCSCVMPTSSTKTSCFVSGDRSRRTLQAIAKRRTESNACGRSIQFCRGVEPPSASASASTSKNFCGDAGLATLAISVLSAHDGPAVQKMVRLLAFLQPHLRPAKVAA